MALVGIAFSIGFIVGPIIGAVFSIWGKERADNWFVYPAYCALALSLLDLVFIASFFEETLPEKQRLKSFSAALKQGCKPLFSRYSFQAPKETSNLEDIKEGWEDQLR